MTHRAHLPTECPLCDRSTFWRGRRPGSLWIGVCVPPVLEPHEVEWLEEPVAALACADEFDEVHDA